MQAQLSTAVLRFLGEVRGNPALAVDPGRLAELERWAAQDLGSSSVATSAPVATLTWLVRAVLLRANDASAVVQIETFGRPVEIVGFLPSVLPITAGNDVVPPIHAFDVNVSRTAGDKRNITSGNQTVEQPNVRQDFSGLDALSATVGNRLISWRIPEAQTNLSIQFRWALDAAIRTALDYADVQITLNIFYKLLTDDERR